MYFNYVYYFLHYALFFLFFLPLLFLLFIYLFFRIFAFCVWCNKLLINKCCWPQLADAMLYSLGVKSTVVNWVEDFLRDRYQRVKLNSDCFSDFKPVPAEIPQGTRIGSWLFLVMINDLTMSNTLCSIWKFADDTTNQLLKYLRNFTVFWLKWPVHDLVLVTPPPPLFKVASNTRPCSKLGGTTLNGGRGEVSILSHRPVTSSDLKQQLFFCESVSTFLQLVVWVLHTSIAVVPDY